jgi:hypothetical protein
LPFNHFHNIVITMPNEVAFADNSRLARNKQPPLRITRRVKDAINAMVLNGADMQRAAQSVGLSTYRLRLALEKQHVSAFYKAQLKVLREARSARNFHRLCEIADAENNMPAVNAIKALEGISDEQTNNKQTNASPGVTIRIVNIATPAQHAIDVSATHAQHDQTNNETSEACE